MASSSQRWKKAQRQTRAVVHLSRELQDIVKRLSRARCLVDGSAAHGSSSRTTFEAPRAAVLHSEYLTKLRCGMRTRIMQHHRFVAGTAASAAAAMSAGVAVTEVESIDSLAELEYWKQGDASLATAEKLREREALRFDRRVVSELNSIWQVVVGSYCRLAEGASVDASTHESLSKEGL